MKRRLVATRLACINALTMLATSAVADTSVSFNGRVLAGTCDVHAEDTATSVTLPPMRVEEITDAVDAPVSASETTFDVHLDNCRGVRQANLLISGTPAGPDSAQYANTGDAQGVAVHLVHAASGKVMPATGFDVSLPVDAGAAAFSARAYYFRLGRQDVTQGLVDSFATVTVSYD